MVGEKMKEKFRIKVRKYKCGRCDLLYLVESLPHYPYSGSCPNCESSSYNENVEYMGEITISQEDGE